MLNSIKTLGKGSYAIRRILIAAGLTAVTMLAAACGSSGSGSATGSGDSHAAVTLRLGFLANITHASALGGIAGGFFKKDLGSNVSLKLTPFSSGTQEGTALLAGQLDAAYVGPNPAIKAWQTSGGKLIKIISGAASGGAELVVKSGITSAAQLKGQSLATPSLGNTQDVALRYWLKQHGLTSTAAGGGDVAIKPIAPNSAPPPAPPSPPKAPGGGGGRPPPPRGRRGARPGRSRPSGSRGAGSRLPTTCRWSRTAVMLWSTRPASGRRASSSPPTWSRPSRSSRRTRSEEHT